MRAVIYTETTPQSDIVAQYQVLSEYAQSQNYKVVRSYSDTDILNKPPKSLTGLQGVLRSAEEYAMEILLVNDMALLGVNLAHMLNIIQVLSKHKVGVYFLRQGLTTQGDAGRATLKVLSHMAEAESRKSSIRIRAGMRQAVANGVRLGRPSVVNTSIESCVVALRQRGMSIANIAKTVRIGVGTTYRILRDADAMECA